MHQRDTETNVLESDGSSGKVVRHKPFYAAEVVMKGLDLRALLAIFEEPLKKLIPLSAESQQEKNYRTRNILTETPLTSTWYDEEDFIELDWTSSAPPVLHILPVVTCPHLTYFKRNSALSENPTHNSKFGIEDTHICLLGKEPGESLL